ncbi:hypothetical protein M9Y10_012264 [Tritrichomonas musculus]|uniref:Shwachman-Bodian-Diamond syndrome protein n=1 Tax=Tritrichomonas musculus TaxID=1915356 RepID=A0ABR2ID74_9EUKA
MIKQPLGQKILSNVSFVKLNRRNKHFEIAVFPNKVTSWRNGLETDIDNVVQSHSIFVNVDQGMLAKQSVVLETLQVKTMDEALKVILDEGQITLAEKERNIVISNLTKDIASIVASQCVNTNTQRPLTTTMVERAMKSVGFNVKPNKAPKAQAIKLIRFLQEKKYPITRARIRLKFIIKNEMAEKMISMLPIVESVEAKDDMTVVIAQVDPGNLRPLARDLAAEFGTNIGIDILELYVTSTKSQDSEKSTQSKTDTKNSDNDNDNDSDNDNSNDNINNSNDNDNENNANDEHNDDNDNNNHANEDTTKEDDGEKEKND